MPPAPHYERCFKASRYLAARAGNKKSAEPKGIALYLKIVCYNSADETNEAANCEGASSDVASQGGSDTITILPDQTIPR